MSTRAADLSNIVLASVRDAILLQAGRGRKTPGWSGQGETHEFCELVIVARGSLTITTGKTTRTCTVGDILYYPERLFHREVEDTGNELEMLFLRFTWNAKTPQQLLVVPDTTGRVRLLMEWLLAERDPTSKDSASLTDFFFKSALAVFIDSCRPEDSRLEREVRRYVGAHMEEALTLADLARAVHLSKYYFLRRYKQATGRTPMEDVRRMRVEYARQLILTTDLPLKAIAPLTGLGSEYALSKVFKKVLGVNPSSLRRRNRNR